MFYKKQVKCPCPRPLLRVARGKGALLGIRNQRLRIPTPSPSLKSVKIDFQASAIPRKVLVPLCC